MAKLLQMPLLFGDPTPDEPEDHLPLLSADPVHDVTVSPEQTPDAEARAQALDIQRSWIVEAPAGSGKTGLLIQRFLKLLAFGEAQTPGEVLALTFTRKAGAEMRHRVLGQLSAAARNVPLSPGPTVFEHSTRKLAQAVLARDHALGWRLLEHPRQLNIRTIDSLCAELAGSLPLLAGAGGRYRPTDDPQPLYNLAAERTLLHMDGRDPGLTQDLQTLLLHRDARAANVVELLAEMLKQRDQWGELVPLDASRLTDEALDAEVRPRLTRTLERLIARELQAASALLGHDLLNAMSHLAHAASSWPAAKDGAHPFAPFAELPEAPNAIASDLPQWVCLANLVLTRDGKWRSSFSRGLLGVDSTPQQKQELQYLIADAQRRAGAVPALAKTLSKLRNLPEAAYPDEQWHIVKTLCRVLRHALLELQIVFAERRQCDFTEVALTARELFRSEAAAPDLLRASVGTLRHLLVDEMQDTSAGQYDLLQRLTATWDGRTQTVFLVGDPKQSIYEFRQARVERFLRVMTDGRFGDLPLGPLRLSSNFRSQAALVTGVNGIFGTLLPSPEELAGEVESPEVPFVGSTPARLSGASPAICWHAAVESGGSEHGDGPSNENLPALQARALREVIDRFSTEWNAAENQPRRPPRIAVLARNRSHLAPIVQEFHQDRGKGPLPFRAVDVEALNERPEILDLLSLTRALLEPSDRVAWLSVLRSPLCGLSLADLLQLVDDASSDTKDVSIASLIEARQSLLSAMGQSLLARSWRVLATAVEDRGRTCLRTHVQRTWASLGGEAPLKAHERSNAGRFLDLLAQVEASPEGFSLSLLQRRLRSLYAVPAAADATVELMTIHKAKGLEWDLVLVPALHRGSGRSSHELLKWLEFDSPEDDQADFLLAPIQGKGDAASKLSGWLNGYRAAREASEAKRLLYVACTRAREELHLFATVKRKADGTLAEPAAPTSLLRAAWPVAAPIIDQQLSPPRQAEVVVFPSTSPQSFALAAAAEDDPVDNRAAAEASPSALLASVLRLPLGFQPEAAFDRALGPGLPYPPASALRSGGNFDRPEGSFSARAFGNVVHRFLPLLADRLEAGATTQSLLGDLPSWHGRLVTSLRTEGLALPAAVAAAERALKALQNTLRDPAGLWLLSPHAQARNEASLVTIDGDLTPMRADRTFLAGTSPETVGDTRYLWIVDYKTAELGSRPLATFLAEQQSKYVPQMQAYAATAAHAGFDPRCIRLALYFPLLPSLVVWPAEAPESQK